MPKNSCPKCGNDKDKRAKHCRKCMEQPRPREGCARLLPKLGYMYVMVNGKGVFEHRHIMEMHIGRKLSRTEHVHHKNGIKTDNRIDNLQLMDGKEHNKEHMTSEVAKQMSILGHRARWGGQNSYV